MLYWWTFCTSLTPVTPASSHLHSPLTWLHWAEQELEIAKTFWILAQCSVRLRTVSEMLLLFLALTDTADVPAPVMDAESLSKAAADSYLLDRQSKRFHTYEVSRFANTATVSGCFSAEDYLHDCKSCNLRKINTSSLDCSVFVLSTGVGLYNAAARLSTVLSPFCGFRMYILTLNVRPWNPARRSLCLGGGVLGSFLSQQGWLERENNPEIASPCRGFPAPRLPRVARCMLLL